eukprot:885567-Amphidinium_carterae.1
MFCEERGFGGFVVHEGNAYYRSDAGEKLLRHRSDAGAVRLYIGFAHVALNKPLSNEQRANVGTIGSALPSLGSYSFGSKPLLAGQPSWCWLARSDYVLSFAGSDCIEGWDFDMHELAVEHGFPRQWPDVQHEPALQKLLQPGGVLHAERHEVVPSSARLRIAQEHSMLPLLSFSNAVQMADSAGLDVVKGWAVYDLYGDEVGQAYMAERYWWNMDDQGAWLDFTPHMENSEKGLLLVAEKYPPLREETGLCKEMLKFHEQLLERRFPKWTLMQKLKASDPFAMAFALNKARSVSGAALPEDWLQGGLLDILVRQVGSNMHTSSLAGALLALLTPHAWMAGHQLREDSFRNADVTLDL